MTVVFLQNGMIVFVIEEVIWHRYFGSRHRETRTMRKLIKVVLVTVTFLVFFYSTTVAMSIMYELDSALLRF